MKQYENPNAMVEKLLLPVLKSNEVPPQQLSEKEKSGFRKPSNVSSITFYSEDEASKPPDERKKVVMNFNRSFKNALGGKEKYGIAIGNYIIPLRKEDFSQTKSGNFIESTHEKSGTVNYKLLIPAEIIEKFNPEFISLGSENYKTALIKIKSEHFNKLLNYVKIGDFASKLSAFVDFHKSEKTAGDFFRFRTFFKKKGIFDDHYYGIFFAMKGLPELLAEKNPSLFLNRFNNIINENFKTSLPAKKLRNLYSLAVKVSDMSPEQVQSALKEIEEMKRKAEQRKSGLKSEKEEATPLNVESGA